MKIVNKVGDTISQSVNFIIDKNRQAAQLNRLKAIIQSETEALDNAYIALGKQYLNILEGKPSEDIDTSVLRENIENSKLRLKKARARYEYTLKYGIPSAGTNVEDTPEDAECKKEGCTTEKKADTEEDEQDITIAYADPTAAIESDAIDAEPVTAESEEKSDESK